MQQHEVIQVSGSQEEGFGVQLIKQCAFPVNTFVVGAMNHPDVACKFIKICAVWLGECLPTQNINEKNRLDWLIIKFTKRYLTLNF